MPSLRDILNNADNDSQPRVASGSPSLPPNLPRSLHFANSFDLPTHHASSSASPSRGDPPKCVASCRPFAPPPRPPQRRDGTCSNASEPPRCSSSHPPLPAAASAIVPGKGVLGCGDRLTRPVTITGRVLWFRRGDLIHTCAQCFKTFTRAEHLRRHLPVHTAPSLACDVSGCGKLFHIKHQLVRHQRREHGQQQGSSRAAEGWPCCQAPPPSENGAGTLLRCGDEAEHVRKQVGPALNSSGPLLFQTV